MKVIQYSHEPETRFDNDMARGVSGRVVIGKADGASQLSACACSSWTRMDSPPGIAHDWEHEIFFHAGRGEVWQNGSWTPVEAGSVAFIPGNEEHQIRNAGDDRLIFVCLIPSGAPEL
jgi:mannose-6-phosphate isomerase-like protein (cupin superfamily)